MSLVLERAPATPTALHCPGQLRKWRTMKAAENFIVLLSRSASYLPCIHRELVIIRWSVHTVYGHCTLRLPIRSLHLTLTFHPCGHSFSMASLVLKDKFKSQKFKPKRRENSANKCRQPSGYTPTDVRTIHRQTTSRHQTFKTRPNFSNTMNLLLTLWSCELPLNSFDPKNKSRTYDTCCLICPLVLICYTHRRQ